MTITNNVCKRCGYCEHCKRSDTYPYVQPPVIYPQYPYYPAPYWSTVSPNVYGYKVTSTGSTTQVNM